MRYYRLDERPFWVEVSISKIGGNIHPRNCRGEGLVPVRLSPGFRRELIHATITGLEKDEQADRGC